MTINGKDISEYAETPEEKERNEESNYYTYAVCMYFRNGWMPEYKKLYCKQ